jgi:hypothetical protein
MTAKSMNLVGQVSPIDIRETTKLNTIDELREIIESQVKERYANLVEEHLNRI